MSDMFEVDNEAILNLVSLAKAASEFDPIDFRGLQITEEQAYIMMATHVLEMERNHLTDGAENLILNLKLAGM